jgi:hypothetical protein
MSDTATPRNAGQQHIPIGDVVRCPEPDLAVLRAKREAALAKLRDLNSEDAPDHVLLHAYESVKRCEYLIREAKRRQRKDAA